MWPAIRRRAALSRCQGLANLLPDAGRIQPQGPPQIHYGTVVHELIARDADPPHRHHAQCRIAQASLGQNLDHRRPKTAG
jgi:hypothetical protein